MQTRSELMLRQQRSLAMTADLRRAIGLLKLSNADLSALLARIAATNPAVCLATEGPRPADPGARPAAAGGIAAGGTDLAEATLAGPGDSLHGHVLHQIGMTFRDPQARAIAEAFAAALEPSGWLRLGPADIAAETGCTPARAEAVLVRLQTIDPAGLFARSLAECLRLQAADRDELTPAMDRLLDHLDLLADGRFEALSRLCGVPVPEVRALLAQLRRYDPKPGARFGGAPLPVRPPDLIVQPEGVARWSVDLNRASAPAVIVDEDAAARIDDATRRETALAEARWLARAVSRRNASTLRIAAAVVRRQGEYLRRGPAGLAPLTLADIAAETGLHDSTVSRVVSGLLVQTPAGVWTLRSFFSVGLPAADGATIAAAAVRAMISRLIAAEPPDDPLSDAAICAALRAQGYQIARRTVAKYRGLLGVPDMAARRAARAAAGRPASGV